MCSSLIYLLFHPVRPINRNRERNVLFNDALNTLIIYGYMASHIWLRTILIVRKETRCRHIGYSFRLTTRVLLYAPSHRQDCTYHGICYTSRGALAGTKNSSMGPPHDGSIRRPIGPRANALTTELHLAPCGMVHIKYPLLLIGKCPLSLSGPIPYIRRPKTVNMF